MEQWIALLICQATFDPKLVHLRGKGANFYSDQSLVFFGKEHFDAPLQWKKLSKLGERYKVHFCPFWIFFDPLSSAQRPLMLAEGKGADLPSNWNPTGQGGGWSGGPSGHQWVATSLTSFYTSLFWWVTFSRRTFSRRGRRRGKLLKQFIVKKKQIDQSVFAFSQAPWLSTCCTTVEQKILQKEQDWRQVFGSDLTSLQGVPIIIFVIYYHYYMLLFFVTVTANFGTYCQQFRTMCLTVVGVHANLGAKVAKIFAPIWRHFFSDNMPKFQLRFYEEKES